MSVPGAVQLFIPETLFWTCAIVIFTGFCSWRWLWSSLKSTNHWAWVLFDASFSCMPLCQYNLVSLPGGSAQVLLPAQWEYTLDSWVVNILLLFHASMSLLYLFRQATKAVSLCLAVSSGTVTDSLLYFFSHLVVLTFSSSNIWQTSLLLPWS